MREPKDMIITKEILKDLRAATWLTIRRDSKGFGSLTVTLEPVVYGKKVEVRKTWLVDATLRTYEKGLSLDDNLKQHCVASMGFINSGLNVESSVIKILKAGDDISFQFIGANNNQLLNDAGLFHDQLNIIIKRKDHKLKFRLDDQVSGDTSARMVGRQSQWTCDIDIHSYDLENRVLPEDCIQENDNHYIANK